MPAWLVAFAASLKAAVDARDIILGAGLALLAAGLAQVSIPLAFIVPGGVLIYVAIWCRPQGSGEEGE